MGLYIYILETPFLSPRLVRLVVGFAPHTIVQVRFLESRLKEKISCKSLAVDGLPLTGPGRGLVEVRISWPRHPGRITKNKKEKESPFWADFGCCKPARMSSLRKTSNAVS